MRQTLGRTIAGRRPVAGSVPAGHGRRWPRPAAAKGLARRSPTSRRRMSCVSAIARARRRSRSSIRPTGRSATASNSARPSSTRSASRSTIANLKIEYVKVTSDDRIPAVVQNKIDLECGSTTANAERAKQVAFSPLMFVAGTKLMVPKASAISAADRSEGQDRGGDQGHHQRAGDARCRQEVRARPQHRDVARSRAILPDAGRTARPMRSRPTTSCSTA